MRFVNPLTNVIVITSVTSLAEWCPKLKSIQKMSPTRKSDRFVQGGVNIRGLPSSTESISNDDEFPVPQSWGLPVAMSLLTGFLGFFGYLAIINLLYRNFASTTSIISSCIWLILICLIVYGLNREYRGINSILVRFLGFYSLNHSLWIEQGAKKIFCYGYRLIGRRFYYLRVGLADVTSVSWSAGQASDMSGRDCDDWQVFVHFQANTARTTRMRPLDCDTHDIECIGGSGSRVEIEKYGKNVALFLGRAGLTLILDDSKQRFIRASPETEK